MIRASRLLLAVVLLSWIPLTAHAADEVEVSQLVGSASDFEDVQVIVEGELVGDYGERNDGSVWSQLNGDPYVDSPLREGGKLAGANVGIGVRIPGSQAVGLDPPGGYRYRGPVVRLTGTWKYHDPARQGESYLEVSSLEVVQPGRYLDESVNWTPLVIGGVLLLAAGFVVLRAYRMRGSMSTS